MPSEIAATVRKFIAENFLYRDGLATLSDSDSLLAAGIIDSTGILELVAFIEKSYSIRVADEEILPDNLDSIQQISAYIGRKVSESRAPAGGAYAR